MNIDYIFPILWIVLVIAFITVFAIATSQIDKLRNLACNDLGLEEYRYIEGFEFCEDEFGNLHYVNEWCDYTWWLWATNCTVKSISVGEVRVK